jgi:dynein heavy chain
MLKVRAQGVEEWMKALEEYMVTAMQKKIKEANNKYYEDGNDRNIWVLSHISQVVAIIDQVTWTIGTEDALSDMLDDDNPFAMEDHFQVVKE